MSPARFIPVVVAILHLAILSLGAVAPAIAQPRGAGSILRRKLPRAGGPKRNPAQVKNQLNRINRLSPDERKRLLDRLPPERRKEAETRLKRFNDMSPREQDRLLREYSQFQEASPERQRAVRRLWGRFNEFPDERKPAVREEVQLLRRLSPEDRADRLGSPEFRDRYDPAERRFLGDLSGTFEQELPPRRDDPGPAEPE